MITARRRRTRSWAGQVALGPCIGLTSGLWFTAEVLLEIHEEGLLMLHAKILWGLSDPGVARILFGPTFDIRRLEHLS